MSKSITHQQWCDITAEKLRQRNFSREHLEAIARGIQPIGDLHETLRQLSNQGTALYVVSGSVREIIAAILGPSFSLFSEIKANEIQFDKNGTISGIRGSQFDFEGKATYIKRVISELNCAPMEVLFVGNSLNDIWASQSGARTLCVNPADVEFTNTLVWTDFIREMSSLKEILPHAERAD